MELKQCKDCGEDKPIEEFSKFRDKYRRTYCVACSSIRQKMSRYKQTREDILNILEEENCAICNVFVEGKNKHIDHDHSTGNIRGILCRDCNRGLGCFKDSQTLLLNSINYLQDGYKENATKETRSS